MLIGMIATPMDLSLSMNSSRFPAVAEQGMRRGPG
jgi:hypothetical protein